MVDSTFEQGPSVTHGMAETEPRVRLHYVIAGAGPRVVVLLHGFPQTWYEWRLVIPALANAGFRVVAPDYRGAGHSWSPAGGYDKHTMAGDLRRLVRDHLQFEDAVALVGHDIGLMVAYAYAQAYRDEVSHLAVVDAPLPGTTVFDRIRSDPRVWHFAFQGARDVPEMLVFGRERQYLQAFFAARVFDPSAISERDLDVYVSAYSAPGAMRAGFELYRAFDQDAEDNRQVVAKVRLLEGRRGQPPSAPTEREADRAGPGSRRRDEHVRTARRGDDARGRKDRRCLARTADRALDPRGEPGGVGRGTPRLPRPRLRRQH